MPEPNPNPEPNPEPTSPVNPDGTFVDNWYGKYGKENEAHLSRYKNFDEVVKSHISQRKKFSKDPDTLVEIPTEHSSDEVRAAWSKARGRPDTNDLYEYTLSDEYAVKLGPLDDKKMAAFREFAYKHNWSQKEFKEALDLYHANTVSDIDAFDISYNEKKATEAAAGKAELMTKEGWHTEEEYKSKVLRANSVMNKYGGVEAVAEFNAENSPKMTMFLNNIADAMSEDTLKGLGSSTGITAANIETQIAEIYEEINKIMKENPANFKGNIKYKDLIKRKHELNKQKQKSA